MSDNISEKDLVEAALKAQKYSYSPYSKFTVGAALVDEQNRIFTGCNVENISFGATCCAERTAIFKAISEGSHQIKILAVVCGQESFCMPCGICRQVIAEFAHRDFRLLAVKQSGEYKKLTLAEILPFAFSFDAN